MKRLNFLTFPKKKVKENENEKLIEKVQTTCIKKNQTLSLFFFIFLTCGENPY
jgi:hypothetical protein